MSFLFNQQPAEKEAAEGIEYLIAQSSPRHDYFLMLVLSVVMAGLGLLLDNGAIIIGSMLIAPLLYPILSLSLGMILLDGALLGRSIVTFIQSTIFGVTYASILTFIFNHGNPLNITSEIISRTEPSIAYFMVAIVAGIAASYALLKPQLNERLPGVAISVALIPPLAVVGIGIAVGNWYIAWHSFLLYIANVCGIILASSITFAVMHLAGQRKVATKAVAKDTEELVKEGLKPNNGKK